VSVIDIPAPTVTEGYMGGTAFTGGNYSDDKWISAKDIAAKVRAYVKAAIKAGEVEADVKVRVTSESYAGGQAVNIVFSSTQATSDWDSSPLWDANPDFDPDNPFDPRSPERTLRPSVKALSAKAVAYGKSFTQSDVNSQVDYFNVSCYVSAYTGGPASVGGGTCI
jgi:hypothetical protein